MNNQNKNIRATFQAWIQTNKFALQIRRDIRNTSRKCKVQKFVNAHGRMWSELQSEVQFFYTDNQIQTEHRRRAH